jgi:hypothetical protein
MLYIRPTGMRSGYIEFEVIMIEEDNTKQLYKGSISDCYAYCKAKNEGYML